MKSLFKILLTLAVIAPLSVYAFSTVNTYSTNVVAASNQYLSATDSASLAPGNMTWEVWIRPTATSVAGARAFVIGKDISGAREYALGIGAAGSLSGTVCVIYAQISGGDTTADAATIQLTAGKWYHLAFVINNTNKTILEYVNGELDQSTGYATTIVDTTTDLDIGRRLFGGIGDPNNTPFDGDIDEVRFYNVERTQAQIRSDYLQEVGGSASNLQAYWKLNNALTDSTANANTLTNHSATFTQSFPFTVPVSWGHYF